MKAGAAAVLLLAAVAQPAAACRLLVPAEAARERLAGFSLEGRGAAVRVARLPPGWTLSVTNEPSWTTRAAGHAIVGAAFLSGGALASLLTVQPGPGATCGTLRKDRAVSVTLTVYRDDRTVDVPVDPGRIGIRP